MQIGQKQEKSGQLFKTPRESAAAQQEDAAYYCDEATSRRNAAARQEELEGELRRARYGKGGKLLWRGNGFPKRHGAAEGTTRRC